MKIFILNLLTLVMFNACSLPGGKIPPDHFYRLPEATPVNTATAMSAVEVNADGIYNERAMLFVEESQPLEVQRYHYHFWTQTPALLAQHYLTSCLNVSAHNTGPVLHVAIRRFERKVQTGQAQAVLTLLINNREYQGSANASSMALHDTARAFGAAMQQICEAVAAEKR